MTGGMYDAVFYSCFNVISMLMLSFTIEFFLGLDVLKIFCICFNVFFDSLYQTI